MPITIHKPGDDDDKVGFGRLHFHTFQGASPDPDQQPDQPTDSQAEPEPPKMRDYVDTDEYWPALIAYQRENDEDEDFRPDDEDVEEAFRRAVGTDTHPVKLADMLGYEFQDEDYKRFTSWQDYLEEVLSPYAIYSASVDYDMSWAPGYGDGSYDVHQVYELRSGRVFVMYFNDDDFSFDLMPEGYTLDDVTDRIVSNMRMFCGDRWEGTTASLSVNSTWRDLECSGHDETFKENKTYPISYPDYRRLLLGFPREPDADQSWREVYEPEALE